MCVTILCLDRDIVQGFLLNLIFEDEIDSIGRKPAKSSAMGGNDERENTLNQLLV